DGPDRAACEARAKELRVRDRVRFVGAQVEVETILPHADLFLLPSEYESFGLAALEAMACGTPPVAFRSGGVPEVVRDGVEGMLAPPCDDAALARAVLDLLGSPERLRGMRGAARAGAIDRFATEKIVPLYEAVYARALSSAAGAKP